MNPSIQLQVAAQVIKDLLAFTQATESPQSEVAVANAKRFLSYVGKDIKDPN